MAFWLVGRTLARAGRSSSHLGEGAPVFQACLTHNIFAVSDSRQEGHTREHQEAERRHNTKPSQSGEQGSCGLPLSFEFQLVVSSRSPAVSSLTAASTAAKQASSQQKQHSTKLVNIISTG